MLIPYTTYKDKTIFIDNSTEWSDDDLQNIITLCEYAYTILSTYNKDRYPTALRKSSLLNKFKDLEHTINKIDEVMKVKQVRGLPKFFYSFWNGIKVCKYCNKQESIFINYKKGYKDYCNSTTCVRKFVNEKCVNEYGVDNFMKIPEIRDKATKTNLKKYGSSSPLGNKYIRDKIKQTNIKKFGGVSPMSSELVREKVKQTNIKKYGIANYSPISADRSKIKPYELDILFEKSNLAIEMNGLMYHSYGKSKSSIFNNYDSIDKYYHLRKTEMCEAANIQLLHIFENEWHNPIKKEIWLSIISAKLGITKQKIYGRKCEIKELSNNDVREFLNRTHLQGFINSKVNIGLFYNGKLVSLMTFGKPRFNNKYEWELLRFSNELNTIVIGGFSKLLKYFEKTYKPKSLLSYANRRISNGSIYRNNGFTLQGATEPNYFYFHPNNATTLYSRVKFQKHKLPKLLNNFDIKKTGMDNMVDNGYRIIYDCGNLIYTKLYI